MCLGVPAKVIDIREEEGMKIAVLEVGGAKIEALLTLEDDIKPGDYVIVHAGIVISKINEEELETVLRLWRELAEEIDAVQPR